MKIKFVPNDIWIGLYFKHDVVKTEYHKGLVERETRVTTFYLCIIPCFPIIWKVRKTS